MEISILKETNDFIELEVKGEGHTLCNILRNELVNVDGVNFASYNLKHPVVGIPVIAVNVSKGKPKKAILDSVNQLKEKTKEMRSLLKKL